MGFMFYFVRKTKNLQRATIFLFERSGMVILSNMVNFYCGVYYSEYVMVNMYAPTVDLQYQEYKCPKEKLSNKIKSFKMFCLTCFVMLGWNLEGFVR